MLGKIILTTLFAGLLAGIVMACLQIFRLEPLIVVAETFEKAGEPTSRSLFSRLIPPMLAGVGFGIVTLGISMLSNIPITKQNGLFWGMCGFLAVALAPAASLPPTLPGMAVAELIPRQIWWVATVAATGIAIFLIVVRPETWAKAAAVVLIALPHVIGAPQAADTSMPLPAHIAATFVASSIAAAAVFWLVLGFALGQLLDKYQKDLSEP